jgi:hypothetical protein
MTKDEALRLALEALENSVDLVRENAYSAEQLYGNYPARQGKVRGLKVLVEDHEKAITAIKAALEAKDEPVATKNNDGVTLHLGWDDLPVGTKLYATPPQRTWVGLTDEDEIDWEEGGNLKDLVKAIEAKLKEKNCE